MRLFFLLLIFTGLSPIDLLHAQVTVKQDEQTITLSNNIITVGFQKNNADLNRIIYKGKSLLNGKDQRGYLLGPGFSMAPSQCTIIRQSSELVEISFYHEADNHFQYDLRYILKKDEPGVYCYLVQTHRAGDSTGDFGQTRWGIRSDESLFDYHLVRDSIQGPMPKMAELKPENEIQDWTYKMADGSVYTKYNFADYIDGRYVHGMAGTKSGLGMFVIQASHEYLNGGPTKQFQNVHSNPYLICMFNCGHFLSDIRRGDNKIADDWVKVDGPFLLYLNDGKTTADIWKDAKQKAETEKKQWPYTWMQHEQYPLERATVSGTLLLNGKPAMPGTKLILAAPGFDWQAQSRGYIFSSSIKKDGSFTLNHVRPGTYTLYAYGSNQTQAFEIAGIQVTGSGNKELGVLNWKTKASKTIFQLGIADRTTGGFKYSNHPRTYGLFDSIPAELDFTIGKNNAAKDWYYAQTKKGSWNIHFELKNIPNGQALLTLALAGAAKNPTIAILVNGNKVKEHKPGNDTGIYRSAVLGGYYQQIDILLPADALKPGENIISINLPDVKPGGGIMYDAVKLVVQ